MKTSDAVSATGDCEICFEEMLCAHITEFERALTNLESPDQLAFSGGDGSTRMDYVLCYRRRRIQLRCVDPGRSFETNCRISLREADELLERYSSARIRLSLARFVSNAQKAARR